MSNNVASRDLKILVDANLIDPKGERRGRFYVASPAVAEIRQKLRLPKQIDDPFAPNGQLQIPTGQANLFPAN